MLRLVVKKWQYHQSSPDRSLMLPSSPRSHLATLILGCCQCPHRYTNQEQFFKVKILSLEPSDFANGYIKDQKSLLPYVPISYIITSLKSQEFLILHKYVQWFKKNAWPFTNTIIQYPREMFSEEQEESGRGKSDVPPLQPLLTPQPWVPTHHSEPRRSPLGANLWAHESLSCRCVSHTCHSVKPCQFWPRGEKFSFLAAR